MVWLASLLARYRITWPLYAIVKTYGGTLTDFVSNSKAAAEMYYGFEPSKKQVVAYVKKFFLDPKPFEAPQYPRIPSLPQEVIGK